MTDSTPRLPLLGYPQRRHLIDKNEQVNPANGALETFDAVTVANQSETGGLEHVTHHRSARFLVVSESTYKALHIGSLLSPDPHARYFVVEAKK